MRRLEDQIEIHAPRAVVWGILSDFSGVATWAPYLRSSSPVGDVEAGVGAYRVLRHFWGFRLEESVIEWDEGTGYTFDVVTVPFPIKDVRETWQVVSENGRVRREMREGLKGLKRHAETIVGRSHEVADAAAIE